MISIVMRPWTQHKIISVIIWPERNYDINESSGMFSPSAWLCSIPETQGNKKCRMKRKSGRALNLYIKKNSLPSLCDDYNSITQISNANFLESLTLFKRIKTNIRDCIVNIPQTRAQRLEKVFRFFLFLSFLHRALRASLTYSRLPLFAFTASPHSFSPFPSILSLTLTGAITLFLSISSSATWIERSVNSIYRYETK